MTLDEHIRRLTRQRAPESSLTSYQLTLSIVHDYISKNQHGTYYLSDLFERFVRFFCELPSDVNIEEALKLGELDSQELERVQSQTFDNWHLTCTLHSHMSEAYEAYVTLGSPHVISEPMDEGTGFLGVPVSFARAVHTVIAYAGKKHIDIAERLDERLRRLDLY